jgi:hypothetical protein
MYVCKSCIYIYKRLENFHNLIPWKIVEITRISMLIIRAASESLHITSTIMGACIRSCACIHPYMHTYTHKAKKISTSIYAFMCTYIFMLNRFFIVGGSRSGTGLHVDPNSTCAWNSLLCGRKRWYEYAYAYMCIHAYILHMYVLMYTIYMYICMYDTYMYV